MAQLSSNPGYYFQPTNDSPDKFLLKNFYKSQRDTIYSIIQQDDPRVLMNVNNKKPYNAFIDAFSIDDKKDLLCFKHKQELPCEPNPFMVDTIHQYKVDWERFQFYSSKYNDNYFGITPNMPDNPRLYMEDVGSAGLLVNKEFLLTSDAVLDHFLSNEEQIDTELIQARIADAPTNEEINNIKCDCIKEEGTSVCVDYNQLLLPNNEPVPDDIKKMFSNLTLVTQTLKGYVVDKLMKIFGAFPSSDPSSPMYNIATDNLKNNKNVINIRKKFKDITNNINKEAREILYSSYILSQNNSTCYIDHEDNTIVYMCNIDLGCFLELPPLPIVNIPMYKLIIVVPVDDLNNYYSFLFIDNGPLQQATAAPNTGNFYKKLEGKIRFYWKTFSAHPEEFDDYGNYKVEYLSPKTIDEERLYTLGGKRTRKVKRRKSKRSKRINKKSKHTRKHKQRKNRKTRNNKH